MKNEFARQLRKQQTDTEIKLWYFLRDRRFQNLKFRRQYPIGPYIVDFCCIEENLIIELDGGQHSVQLIKDKERTTCLEGRGYKVLRFWNNEVLQNPSSVLKYISLVLNAPHPSPLPMGEGKSDYDFH